MAQKETVVRGIGTSGLLGIVFIVMKLLDKIDWSWWWVLSPFWIPIASIILIFVFAIIIAAIVRS